MRQIKLILLALLLSCSVFSADRTLSAEVSQAGQLHTDRTHWFQLMVPDGWQVSSKGKGSNLSEVLTLKDQSSPGAQIVLQIRQLKELPELITRDQLLEQARAILKAATLHKSLHSTQEITGWPMTGVTAEYSESTGTHTRLTILIDVPRQRAFIWKATAPTDIFPRYDITFDRIAAGLVPALPEN